MIQDSHYRRIVHFSERRFTMKSKTHFVKRNSLTQANTAVSSWTSSPRPLPVVIMSHQKKGTGGRDGCPGRKNRLPEGCIRDIDRSIINYCSPLRGETV